MHPTFWCVAGAAGLALAACNSFEPDHDETPTDGSTGATASSGSGGVGELPGEVSVRVYEDGAPVANAAVVFHDPQGAALATTSTDEVGFAVGPAGPLTVVRLDKSPPHLFTILATEDGDTIVVGREQNPDAIVGQLSISLEQPITGGVGFVIDLGCTSKVVDHFDAPALIDVPAGCVHDGKVNVLVFAMTWESEADQVAVPYAFAFAAEVELGAAPTPVVLAALGTGVGGVLLSILDLPTGTVAAKTEFGHARGGVGFHCFARNILAPDAERCQPFGQAVWTGAGASATFVHATPAGFSDAHESSIAIGFGNDTAIDGQSTIFLRDPTLTEQLVVEASTLLERVEAVTLQEGDDRARPVVAWSGTRSTDLDGVLVNLSFPNLVWDVVAPPDVSSPLTFPALPDDLAALRPEAAPDAALVVTVETTECAGWADFRRALGLTVISAPLRDNTAVRRYSVGSSLPAAIP